MSMSNECVKHWMIYTFTGETRADCSSHFWAIIYITNTTTENRHAIYMKRIYMYMYLTPDPLHAIKVRCHWNKTLFIKMAQNVICVEKEDEIMYLGCEKVYGTLWWGTFNLHQSVSTCTRTIKYVDTRTHIFVKPLTHPVIFFIRTHFCNLFVFMVHQFVLVIKSQI